MKKRKSFIQLFSIVGLLFAVTAACDKGDNNSGGSIPNAGTLKDADGNNYKTVKIGNQVWASENLKTTKYNDGTSIPNVTDNIQWESLTTGAYCNYNNLESNATTYGRLYNWYAVNTGKLAPSGWHVATDNDWTILENYLIASGYNFDGTKDVDKIAKSLCAKTNWKLSNVPGAPGAVVENNNSTGFTALPGGIYLRGVFDYNGSRGFWWSSTNVSSNTAFMRELDYFDPGLYRIDHYKTSGLSVRLVKD